MKRSYSDDIIGSPGAGWFLGMAHVMILLSGLLIAGERFTWGLIVGSLGIMIAVAVNWWTE